MSESGFVAGSEICGSMEGQDQGLAWGSHLFLWLRQCGRWWNGRTCVSQGIGPVLTNLVTSALPRGEAGQASPT